MTTVPTRPAAYIRDIDATSADDPDLTAYRDRMIGKVQRLGWPVPTVYADLGPAAQAGSQPQLAVLAEAIAAGRHDGVFATHPEQIGKTLDQIEAFDRLCRQHGARFCWSEGWRDPRALFE